MWNYPVEVLMAEFDTTGCYENYLYSAIILYSK